MRQYLFKVSRRCHQKMLGYPPTIDVFVQMEITAVHLADLAARSLDDHARGSQILIRFIGNNGSVCPALGHIAYVGGRAS